MPRHDLKLKTNRKLADQLIEKGYNEGLPNPFDKPSRPERGRRKKISANQVAHGSRGKRSASADDVTGPILGTSLDESIVSKQARSSSTTVSSTSSSARNLAEGSGGSGHKKSGSGSRSYSRHSNSAEGSAAHSKRSTPKGSLKRGQRSASASDITGVSNSASPRDSNSSKNSSRNRRKGSSSKGSNDYDDDDAEAAAMALLEAKAAAEKKATKANGCSDKSAVAASDTASEPAPAPQSEAVELVNNESNKPAMGATVTHAMETSGNLKWKGALGPAESSVFKVRDYGYAHSKLKVPSENALFEFAGADCLNSAGPISNFAQHMQLPPLPPERDPGRASPVQPYFVVNMQIPRVPKALFGSSSKQPTPTMNSCFYFRCTKATAAALRKLEAAYASGHPEDVNVDGVPPAVQLLRRWCQNAATDPILNGCFKAIGIGFNFKEVGAPAFVSSYNGKPVLFAGSGSKAEKRQGFQIVNSQPRARNGYFHVDVDMHSNFSYLAQRGIAWGFGMAEKLDLALAFLIEGRAGHEQPECVIGCLANKYVPVHAVVDADAFFAAHAALRQACPHTPLPNEPPAANDTNAPAAGSSPESKEYPAAVDPAASPASNPAGSALETREDGEESPEFLSFRSDVNALFGEVDGQALLLIFAANGVTSEARLVEMISEANEVDAAGSSTSDISMIRLLAAVRRELPEEQLKQLEEWLESLGNAEEMLEI